MSTMKVSIGLPFPQQKNISACLRRCFYNLNTEQVSAAEQAKTQPTRSVTILISGKVPNSRVIFCCTLHPRDLLLLKDSFLIFIWLHCSWSFEISDNILRNQKYMIGLDSYSKQVSIYLDPILIYISLWIDCLFEIRKIAVCFPWLSMPGDYRVTDEALLAETT